MVENIMIMAIKQFLKYLKYEIGGIDPILGEQDEIALISFLNFEDENKFLMHLRTRYSDQLRQEPLERVEYHIDRLHLY